MATSTGAWSRWPTSRGRVSAIRTGTVGDEPAVATVPTEETRPGVVRLSGSVMLTRSPALDLRLQAGVEVDADLARGRGRAQHGSARRSAERAAHVRDARGGRQEDDRSEREHAGLEHAKVVLQPLDAQPGGPAERVR